MMFGDTVKYTHINKPNTVGIALMVEALLLWVVPIFIFNFFLNYNGTLLKNIFDVSTIFVAFGIIVGHYSSKYLVIKDTTYIIFEKNRLNRFFKIVLFSFPLVVMFSAIIIKYLIMYQMTYNQTESLILIFILSYGGGICFSIGYKLLKMFKNI